MDSIQAIVQKVIHEGRHGPYAVALSEDERRINFTFSLLSPIWNEETFPESGTFVILTVLSKKRSGWRANGARFLKPAD